MNDSDWIRKRLKNRTGCVFVPLFLAILLLAARG